MNSRPKPNEDEEDLLKLQQAFLSSSSAGQPSVTIKRPDKRRTDDKQTTPNRDVVAMEASTSVEPSVVPAKKSKFRTESGPDSSDQSRKPISHRDKEADGEDIEELMDKKDRSLAAVLTTIIERDTRNEIYVAPVMSRQAFPCVRPMDLASQAKSQSTPPAGKTKRKSLFAQQVEAQGAKHFGVEPRIKPFGGVSEKLPDRNRQETESYTPTLPGPCVIDGGGLSASNRQSESQKIHEENAEKLSAMSEEEILEEQKKLLEMIDPKLVEFLRNKRKVKEKEMETSGTAANKQVSFSVHKEMKKKQMQSTTAEGDDEGPVKPSKDWLNMSTVERDKLEWMKDLPPPASVSSQTGRPARFDFKGHLMAVDADVPVNIGLHHHGEEPERAGYSLEELFQLARSYNIQQRSLALHTLARVICQAKSGYLSGKIETPIIPAILAGGVVMLLRWALDDSVEAVVFAAVDALHAMLCSPLDEESVDTAWVWYLGHIMPALTPTATLEKEAQPAEDVDFENQEEETDADVVKRDVIQALVTRMELLIRFRYIFSSMKPQAVTVVQILDVLSRISQHSSGMAYEVMKCPGLMEKIVKEYLLTAWAPQDHDKPVSDVSGLPVPAAMRLLRSLCQAGRNMASVLVSKFQLNMILLRYLAVQSSDLQLHQTEATNLQAETLAVWRVCATYGLLSQTYFDMYSNILPSVGKLADRWMSALGEGKGDHKPTETRQNSFEEHLLCVIEKILCVAASSREQPGFTGSNPGSKETVSSPPINWSHVTALVQPIRTCVTQMLSEIGAHYPVKKHNLALPTACLNFLATFCELEGKQKGVDEVSSLEALENLCSSCLGPLWSSFGLSVIIENLCQYSNILASSAFLPVERSPSLPTLCVCQVTDNEEMPADPDTSPEEWKINMPVLRHHSPFGFLTALMRMMLVTCRRHKSMIPKLLDDAVNNKDILMYMKKVCSVSKSSFSSVHFTRAENLFQYYWLKCCTLMPCKEMSLAHRVSLHLIARLQHGDEHLVHDLVSTVVFTASFISEGEETQLASQAMASMSLSETLHLKSASQEEINISKHQLLQDVYKSLAKIRGHFIMAFGGMEKAVQDSRNLFVGNCQETCSQLIKGGGESLMPRDWTYMPLIHVYNKATQTNSVSGVSMSPQAVSMVTSVLQWNYALEMWRPVEMDSVSVTLRLSRIMCAFIAGSDLFLEKPVNQYLAGLLRVLTSQKLLDKMDFEEKIPGILSFYDLYQEFLDHYEAVSFGDPVFGLYVLLPQQQKHSFMLRKAVWGERRKLLRTLRVPLNEMLIPIQNYLEPDETDTELLQLYLSALVAKAVQPIWSPVMYLLAVHHVNRFLYLSVTDDNVLVRSHMWRQVLANENQMSDVIYYKQADISLPRGLELYQQLPANRQNTLDKHESVKKS